MSSRFASLSDDQLRAIHEVCESFEKTLTASDSQAGERACVGILVESAPADIAAPLLRELLSIEMEWRVARGEIPTVLQLLARFPNHGDVVEEVYQRVHGLVAAPANAPWYLGRYRIESVLGEGAFGVVYKAHDEVLNRTVAVKIPHRGTSAAIEGLVMTEARSAARLQHPHIVPVFDVLEDHEHATCIVSQYVAGTNLAKYLKQRQLHFVDATKIAISIAEALHHAHTHGLVHRDVKPANVLVDSQGEAHLTDFGLALHEDAWPGAKGVAGTAAYMSPEQARGEGHRVDKRSDIFSLGTVLYEMLCGTRPFQAATVEETLQLIETHVPSPIWEYDDRIPEELQWICAKAMSKRASERYGSAREMSTDLRRVLARLRGSNAGEPPSSGGDAPRNLLQNPAPEKMPRAARPDGRRMRIAPKGLRAFDEHDTDFFLDLLPGPRDREGLPESVRFWLRRIEELDADNTFSVGLIYGPSGSGKSSFVKAGLLTRLSGRIATTYVEASSHDTEARILRRLRSQFPALPSRLDLPKSLAALRRGDLNTLAARRKPGPPAVGAQTPERDEIGPTKKLLLVIDQFEQWLHAWGCRDNAELVQALRQCDGGQVQCLLLVRDDFWMAISRFMQALEIPLLEGQNSKSVDLLPVSHTRNVLTALGQAFGTLPDDPECLSDEQREFVERAADGLATDGKVVCVRLALFAQMMKDRVWAPMALDAVGGVAGIGTAFLEETFCGANAPPENRYHEQGARAILKCLLPDWGTEIKGNSLPYAALCQAAGYGGRQREFEECVRILDQHLRLISPCDGPDTADAQGDGTLAGRRYQLTHDYLVPSIRNWLTRKQRESRAGRAELRLKELAALWNAKRLNRLLPSAIEYLDMRLRVSSQAWTPPQRDMMSRAARFHAQRGILAGIAIFLVIVGIQQAVTRMRLRNDVTVVATAVDALENAQGPLIPVAIDALKRMPGNIVLPELRQRFSRRTESHQKFAIACGLAEFGDIRHAFFVDAVATVSPAESRNLLMAMVLARDDCVRGVQARAQRHAMDQDWRLVARHAITALHLGDATMAADMCHTRRDLTRRSVFIDEFVRWNADVEHVAELVETADDADLRASLCMAVGLLSPEQLGQAARDRWSRLFLNWYQTAPDSLTHSASGWALRRWDLAVPRNSGSAAADRKWHETDHGVTMIFVPAGSFVRRDNTIFPHGGEQTVVLTAPFWLSDREISRQSFAEFLRDADTPDHEKPVDWSVPATAAEISPTVDHPMNNVSWFDAVMFCNWLSRKEGLQPAYHRVGPPRNAWRHVMETWHWDRQADGYRLPTEAEWELACRAHTDTPYFFGQDLELAPRYGVFASGKLQRPESMLPNGSGFFGMLGNVSEWCYDWSQPYPAAPELRDPVSDHQPDEHNSRVTRGGTFFDYVRKCRSDSRNRNGAWSRADYDGFRVARSIIE